MVNVVFSEAVLTFWNMFGEFLFAFLGLCLISYIFREINEILIAFAITCPIYYFLTGNLVFLFFGLACMIIGGLLRYARI